MEYELIFSSLLLHSSANGHVSSQSFVKKEIRKEKELEFKSRRTFGSCHPCNTLMNPVLYNVTLKVKRILVISLSSYFFVLCYRELTI